MTENIKTKIHEINWQDFDEVIGFYETNQLYFNNYKNISNEDSLQEILVCTLSYCNALYNKSYYKKALPILTHINILVNRLKSTNEYEKNLRKYLFEEARIHVGLKKYELANDNLKQLIKADPDNDIYKEWFEHNKIALIRKNSIFIFYIGFALIILTIFVELPFENYLFGLAILLQLGGYFYPNILRFLKRLTWK